MSLIASGLLWVVLGGVVNGSFATPMKFIKRWSWESTWLVYSIVGLLVTPLLAAVLSVPHLLLAYRHAGGYSVAVTALFGLGWGVGSVLFGLGIDAVGLALGFAIILGLTAALGTLIPLIVLTPGSLASPKGVATIGGLVIVIIGISLCARAGSLKENRGNGGAEGAEGHAEKKKASRYSWGILICIASGILSSMLNLALAFGQPVAAAAVHTGASAAGGASAIWALAVGAGSLCNIGFTLYLVTRNNRWKEFSIGSGRELVGAIIMGLLWMGGTTIYGVGANHLGTSGAAYGWPLYMTAMIITGNIWGLLTGEWAKARAAPMALNAVGVAVLILAIFVIGLGGAA